jgi:hypothetical protein
MKPRMEHDENGRPQFVNIEAPIDRQWGQKVVERVAMTYVHHRREASHPQYWRGLRGSP